MTVSIRTENLPNGKSAISELKTIYEAPKTKIEKVFTTHFDAQDKGVKLVDDRNIEIANCNASDLHNFILELEKIGKDVRIEKKTIIEIVDRN